jgi:hypothetical protein
LLNHNYTYELETAVSLNYADWKHPVDGGESHSFYLDFKKHKDDGSGI